MDEHFVQRVLKTSVVAGAVLGLFGWVYWGGWWALSFSLVAAWSIVNLWVLERLLVILMQKRSRLALGAVFCLKIPVLYGLILIYLVAFPWRPSALLGGVSLPYAVIVLKAVGHSLVEATARKGTPRETGASDTTGFHER